MSRILIFGGTTEGRLLAETLAAGRVSCDVCVATEYGEQVVDESSYIKVYTGRLTVPQMKELYIKNKVGIIIDATHPFATVVSENILESADNIPVIRFERELGINIRNQNRISGNKNFQYFDSMGDCINALKNTEGKIFVTTGSKDLHQFCKDSDLRNRLIVRVLPAMESLKLCYEAGLEGKQIIAMQGPFSERMNITQIEENNVSVLVTKESGRTGGEDTKLQAALKTGIKCFIIKKPENEGKKNLYFEKCNSISEVCEKIGVFTGTGNCFFNITLAGIGMGNPDNMTVEVKHQIEAADYIFGAERMLESVSSDAKKYPYYLAREIIPELKKLQSEQTGNKKVAILFSGDTGFYSGASALTKELEKLENTEIQVMPGISSLQMLAARYKCSWEHAKIISLHGVEEKIWKPELKKSLDSENQIFMLTSGAEDIKKIAEIIQNQNVDADILIGYRLSYADEELIRFKSNDASMLENITKPGLYSVMLVIQKREK